MSSAITEAITTIALAETRFNLSLTEDRAFFPEWQSDLLALSSHEKKEFRSTKTKVFTPKIGGTVIRRNRDFIVSFSLTSDCGFLRSAFASTRSRESQSI
ncbi:hypothetical protein PN437_08425 [Microcystis aeruginosa CS-564/01]|uniref:hypothetical protein n=1 Tax=Microcystis aeruginosa TaxID=1126 RepID=UPI00232ECD44|nr:hypothetical protein [Microcystis aeruginosa]MDB9424922.1 hypothetical protein [Microcystis aeruginosa CS-564/01]